MKPPSKESTRRHLRLVTSRGAVKSSPPPALDACARAQAALCVAVALRHSAHYDAQLRVLHAHGVDRNQLSDLMTTTVEVAGPETMVSAAEVMDRYDCLCQSR